MKTILQKLKNNISLVTLLCVIAVVGFWKLSILLFLVILLALVIVHEFGHFLAAKWAGMRVDEFAFGFPPRIYAKKKGETVYAINSLPLGGYVSIWGESGTEEDSMDGGAKHHPRAFGNRPKWMQVIVLSAGVFMNMLLALIVLIGLSFGSVQLSASDPVYGSRVEHPSVMVMGSTPGSPAYMAGLVPRSVITKLSSGGANADVTSADKVVAFIETHQNASFAINFIKPDGTRSETVIAAVYGLVPDKKAIGVSLDTVGIVETSVIESVKIGAERTYDLTVLTLQSLWSVVASIGQGGNVIESLAGPIGIAQIVGERSEYGMSAVFMLVAVLSVGLAVFNALPIPGLDGGRIVVVGIEAITRRRVPFKYQMWANIAGIGALVLLFLVVTFNDIVRIVQA